MCFGPLVCFSSLPPQQAGQAEKARSAYEQAAQSQEKLGSAWHAAKHLETCSTISKDLGQMDRVTDYCRQASAQYAQAGRMTAGEGDAHYVMMRGGCRLRHVCVHWVWGRLSGCGKPTEWHSTHSLVVEHQHDLAG